MMMTAQRKADRVLHAALDKWLEQLTEGEGASMAVHNRIAARLGRELRGTSARHIQRVIAQTFDAFEGDRYAIIERAVRRAARAGSGLTPAVARAVFGDSQARRALRPVVDGAADVVARRTSRDMWGETMRERLRRRTSVLGRNMATQVRQSVSLSETTEQLSQRVLRTTDLDVRLPRYIQDVQRASRTAGPSAVRSTVRRHLTALQSGRIPNHDISRETRRFLRQVERSQGADIDQAIETWVQGRAQNQAMTIARTEGHSSLNEAYVESVGEQPWVPGVRWNISGSHEKVDICFPTGTLVSTPDGPRPINELEPGDLVHTADGVHSIGRVSHQAYEGPLAIIEWMGGGYARAVAATPNHPVATERGWIPAGEIQTGHQGFVRHVRGAEVLHRFGGGSGNTAPPSWTQGVTPEGWPTGVPGQRGVYTGSRSDRMIGSFAGQPDTGFEPSLALASRSAVSNLAPSGSGCPPACADEESRTASASDALPRPHTSESNGASQPSRSGGLLPAEQGSGESAHRIQDTGAEGAHLRGTARWHYAGTVWNLHVSGCASYYANGLLVHNCDLMAEQDLHGLGGGGYPAADTPSLAHPNDMCFFTAIVDEHYLDRELARARGEPEPPRPWETTERVTGSQWLQRQPQSTREAILGPARAREFNRRPAAVVNGDGSFNPLYTVQGRPAPVLPEGETFRHRRNGEVTRLGASRVPTRVRRRGR